MLNINIVHVYISYWTMTIKSIPVQVVAYDKEYIYNFDIEKNHVLRCIDELKKTSPMILRTDTSGGAVNFGTLFLKVCTSYSPRLYYIMYTIR